MKKIFFLFLLAAAAALPAQPLVRDCASCLPTQAATLYKNGRALLAKSGRVPAAGGRYVFERLPDPLFGTFWVSAPNGALASVFARRDSVETDRRVATDNELTLPLETGKPVRVWLSSGSDQPPVELAGTVEEIHRHPTGYINVLLRTAEGKWQSFGYGQILRLEFQEKPRAWVSRPIKRAVQTLELRFRDQRPEQEIGLVYLTDSLGWLPVYRLDLTGKNQGRLALRAEVANDAEDLGDAELRLAVGIPNFAHVARGADWMTDFYRVWDAPGYGRRPAMDYYSNAIATQAVMGDMLEEAVVTGAGDPAVSFEGAQAEDFYFYTVRPGNLPRGSRYQFPIFETAIEPAHFYEAALRPAGPQSINQYDNQREPAARPPVFHYIEFANTTTHPWTTGPVNVLSEAGQALYPVSQDLLPYTAPGARCKVRLAQTPEIRIDHGEGDIERNENVKKYFSRTYDQVKVQAQVSVVNHKKEPVRLKVRRQIEGQPLASDLPWTQQQAQATLRVNPQYEVVWEFELKPGEERKWSYTYEVFVNL
jgi:hypothetical protein